MKFKNLVKIRLKKERELAEKEVYCILNNCDEQEKGDVPVRTLQALNEKCFTTGMSRLVLMFWFLHYISSIMQES